MSEEEKQKSKKACEQSWQILNSQLPQGINPHPYTYGWMDGVKWAKSEPLPPVSMGQDLIDIANDAINNSRFKPVEDGIGLEALHKKITDRMNLIPYDPSLSERGAYDAYLNVTNWIKQALSSLPPAPVKDVPVQSEVEEAALNAANKRFHQTEMHECTNIAYDFFKKGAEWQTLQVKRSVIDKKKAMEDYEQSKSDFFNQGIDL